MSENTPHTTTEPSPDEQIVDVHVYYKSGGVPCYLPALGRGEAVRLRDALTTHVTADWLDVDHAGAEHRILASDVNWVVLRGAHPRPERAQVEELPLAEIDPDVDPVEGGEFS